MTVELLLLLSSNQLITKYSENRKKRRMRILRHRIFGGKIGAIWSENYIKYSIPIQKCEQVKHLMQALKKSKYIQIS